MNIKNERQCLSTFQTPGKRVKNIARRVFVGTFWKFNRRKETNDSNYTYLGPISKHHQEYDFRCLNLSCFPMLSELKSITAMNFGEKIWYDMSLVRNLDVFAWPPYFDRRVFHSLNVYMNEWLHF